MKAGETKKGRRKLSPLVRYSIRRILFWMKAQIAKWRSVLFYTTKNPNIRQDQQNPSVFTKKIILFFLLKCKITLYIYLLASSLKRKKGGCLV